MQHRLLNTLLCTGLLLATTVATAGDLRPECPQEARYGTAGNLAIPPSATDIEDPADVDEDLGPLITLYPSIDTSTDAMYPLPCEPSIGGELPPEVDEEEAPEGLEVLAEVENFEKDTLADLLSNLPNVTLPKLTMPTKPVCYYKGEPHPCDSPYFLRDDQPFAGRDIILLHGFSLTNIWDNMSGNVGANQRWPADPQAFEPGGYYYQKAFNYWAPHAREHLWDIENPANTQAGYQWHANQASPSYVPKNNRILIVPWATTQRMEYAQHVFLSHVMRAMNNGHNVLTPPNYPTTIQMPFCANGCIVISHSTGGEIMTTTMGRLRNGDYGQSLKPLTERFRGHIAYSSALGGSRVATAGILASSLTVGSSVVCGFISDVFGGNGLCGWGLSRALNSVLVDLSPIYAHERWLPVMAQSPVTTLTVSGAHTLGNYHAPSVFAFLNTKVLLPGVDDGVVTMDSSCGNPRLVVPFLNPPSGYTVTSRLKAFDMGQPLLRGIGIMRDQHRFAGAVPFSPFLTAMCTPWLSSAGMVMPVSNSGIGTPFSAHERINNVYSFLQGAIDHSNTGGTADNNPYPSSVGEPASLPRIYANDLFGNREREESSAITDSAVFQIGNDGVYPVHPSFVWQPHEYQRGRKLKFKLFGKTYTWWIWRRTYHLLNRWEHKAAPHFVYEYAFRRQ